MENGDTYNSSYGCPDFLLSNFLLNGMKHCFAEKGPDTLNWKKVSGPFNDWGQVHKL